MKNNLLVTIALAFSSFTALAEEVPKSVSSALDTLLMATQENDLEKFKSVCSDSIKKTMSKDDLKKVSIQISALMKLGYKKVYMGVLDKRTFKTYYWKIDFDRDGSPDMLAELSIMKDKVTGFYIR